MDVVRKTFAKDGVSGYDDFPLTLVHVNFLFLIYEAEERKKKKKPTTRLVSDMMNITGFIGE
jgi:hypothetical protein